MLRELPENPRASVGSAGSGTGLGKVAAGLALAAGTLAAGQPSARGAEAYCENSQYPPPRILTIRKNSGRMGPPRSVVLRHRSPTFDSPYLPDPLRIS